MRKLSTQSAAKRADVVPATIMNWCKYPRLTVGNRSMGVLSLGVWKIDPLKLDMVIDGDRIGLIKCLFQEKVKDLFQEQDAVSVHFELRHSKFYLNMFRDEVQYYGRRRKMDLSVEVPFLGHIGADKAERIPIPLPKIMLVEVLDEMGFEKTQNIFYILRNK